MVVKQPYKVQIYSFDCTIPGCENGCIGHHRLGIADKDAVYTLEQANILLADWKRDIFTHGAVLSLHGVVLAFWKRETKRDWPETIRG
jgi:hypothetical protein